MELRRKKQLISILLTLTISLLILGIGFANNGSGQVSLNLPGVQQVFKPGETVEISGTAQNMTAVTLSVRNAKGGLIFTGQPKVINDNFTANFTLEPTAVEGEYTISIGGAGLTSLQTYQFLVKAQAGSAYVTLEKPAANTKFKPGDVVEIAGKTQDVNAVTICVRNDRKGRIYTAQPPVVNGKFSTSFTLSANASAGEYTISIGSDVTDLQNYKFKVTTDTTPVDPDTGGSHGGSHSDGGSEAVPVSTDGQSSSTINTEKHTKKENLNLADGRKGEKLSLEKSVLDTLKKAAKGTKMVLNSTSNVDEVRTEIAAEVLQTAKEKGMLMEVNSAAANYTLPLDSLNLNQIAGELGEKPEKLNLNIVMSKTSSKDKKSLSANLKKGQNFLADPVEFKIEITTPSGKKAVYKSFGKTYVSRSILVNSSINLNQATGVVWNEAQRKFVPVPTVFEKINGKTYATILRRTNSIYTVLQQSKTFVDIQNNWAKDDIELLASKMIINGKSQTTYEPASHITRAEFAALLVRALGLDEGVIKGGQFTDVQGTEWYAGSVAAATDEGIIKGYDNKCFKPNSKITRQEMAVMIARAAKAAGKAETLSTSQQEQQLSLFTDKQSIPDWAAKEIAVAVKDGIINGMPGGEFSPATYANRAQSAVMLKRFLTHVKFISVN